MYSPLNTQNTITVQQVIYTYTCGVYMFVSYSEIMISTGLIEYMLAEKNHWKSSSVTPVMQLTKETFDQVTQSLDLILVGFFVDQ